MAADSLVRPASSEDANACIAVYRPYVEDTAITFETEVPTPAEMAARIAAARKHHEWLVLEHNNDVIGYAYAHAFNPRTAYQWSAETSIYLAGRHHRAGGGRKLYTQLLQRLVDRGYRCAFAGITQPNAASNDFHRSFGFEHVGLYHRVGWKHGSPWPLCHRHIEVTAVSASRAVRSWDTTNASSSIHQFPCRTCRSSPMVSRKVADTVVYFIGDLARQHM